MSKRDRTRLKQSRSKAKVHLPSGIPSGKREWKHDELTLVPLNTAPVWIDRMEFAVRAEMPIATIRFYSVCVPYLVEASRMQTTVQHIKQIVDAFCKSLDYYPTRATKAE